MINSCVGYYSTGPKLWTLTWYTYFVICTVRTWYADLPNYAMVSWKYLVVKVCPQICDFIADKSYSVFVIFCRVVLDDKWSQNKSVEQWHLMKFMKRYLLKLNSSKDYLNRRIRRFLIERRWGLEMCWFFQCLIGGCGHKNTNKDPPLINRIWNELFCNSTNCVLWNASFWSPVVAYLGWNWRKKRVWQL